MENNETQLNTNIIVEKARKHKFPEHRYTFGKQKETLELEAFSKMLEKVDCIDLGKYAPSLVKSFLAILFWTGLRKTEVHGAKPHRYILLPCKTHSEPIVKTTEAVRGILKEDIKEKGDSLFVKAIARKHGKRDEPLELWLGLPHVNLIKQQWLNTKPGERVFPLDEWDSWNIMKQIDKRKYLHFFRLNRITELCNDPEMSIVEICSWTGLTVSTIESYMARSKRFIHSTAEKMRKRYGTVS